MRPFEITRVFDAPRDKVWQAWTEADRLKQWWGPKGFVVTHCKIDLRPGGIMHYCLRVPDGSEMWGKFVYREIAQPERLVFVNSFSDAKGGVTRHAGHANWPLEMLTTVIFEAQGGKTKVTVQWALFDTATDLERKTFDEGRDSMNMGWTGTMDQFAEYLKKGA